MPNLNFAKVQIKKKGYRIQNLGAMPTDVFGRGHVVVGDRHAHEDVGMAPAAG